jgi:hypothetical protein
VQSFDHDQPTENTRGRRPLPALAGRFALTRISACPRSDREQALQRPENRATTANVTPEHPVPTIRLLTDADRRTTLVAEPKHGGSANARISERPRFDAVDCRLRHADAHSEPRADFDSAHVCVSELVLRAIDDPFVLAGGCV